MSSFMVKGATVVALICTLSMGGCKSTYQGYDKQPRRVEGYSALPVSVLVSTNFKSVYAEIEQNLGLSHESYISESVDENKIDILSIKMPDDWYWHAKTIYSDNLLRRVLSKSCAGVVVRNTGNSENERPFTDSSLKFSKYGLSQQESKQVKKLWNGSKNNKKPEFAMLPILIAPLKEYRKSKLSSVRQAIQAYNYSICLVDGKIDSALLFSEIYNTGDVVDNNFFHIAYYPSGFFEKPIKENVEKLKVWNKKEQEIKKIAKESHDLKVRTLKRLNDSHAKVWDERLEIEYNIGDSVCTQDNLLGNVEQVTKDKVKVLWSKKLNELNGFFFGKAGLYKFDAPTNRFEYEYEEINRYDWTFKENVAPCTIHID